MEEEKEENENEKMEEIDDVNDKKEHSLDESDNILDEELFINELTDNEIQKNTEKESELINLINEKIQEIISSSTNNNDNNSLLLPPSPPPLSQLSSANNSQILSPSHPTVQTESNNSQDEKKKRKIIKMKSKIYHDDIVYDVPIGVESWNKNSPHSPYRYQQPIIDPNLITEKNDIPIIQYTSPRKLKNKDLYIEQSSSSSFDNVDIISQESSILSNKDILLTPTSQPVTPLNVFY